VQTGKPSSAASPAPAGDLGAHRTAVAQSKAEVRSRDVTRLALSPDEAAIALGVSRSFFFAEILPSLAVARVGRRRLVPIREIERWLDQTAHRSLPQ
jgi:hypothetical protein